MSTDVIRSRVAARPQAGLDQARAAFTFLVPLGRALFAAIFVLSAFEHFSKDAVGYAASQGVPAASLLVPVAGVMALLGGLSVLLGYQATIGAWLLVAFLVPVTFTMHRFWTISDPMMMRMQQAMFMKNLALIGGALLIAYHGAGPISIDARRGSG